MVAQGWAELVAWMQERSAAGALDIEAVWDQFRALAATSEQPGVAVLAERFHAAPAQERLVLAGTIAGMLGPVEWPVAWRGPGRRLVSAIEELCREMRDDSPDTLPAMLDLGGDRDLFVSGRSQLSKARDLLRAPCPRDEMSVAAGLCEMGTFWSWRALARAFQRPERRGTSAMVVGARARYAVALGVFGEAARAMNDACGAVVFVVADLRVPDEKAA